MRHSNLDDTGHCRIRKHVDRLKILLCIRFVHFFSLCCPIYCRSVKVLSRAEADPFVPAAPVIQALIRLTRAQRSNEIRLDVVRTI
jgi:hypothetical protein